MSRNVLRIAALVLLAIAALAVQWLCPALPAMEADLRDLCDRFGTGGLVLIAVAFTPCCLLLLPGSVLLLVAGYFYGTVPAFIAASVGMTVAAGVIFLVGRTIARGWVEARFGQDPRFRALDHAVAEQGFRIVLLVRLSPLFPFIFVNYALSLTRVRFWTYVLASALGMLPNIALWSYLGASVETFAQIQRGALLSQESQVGQAWHLVLTVVGLIAAISVTFMITRLARRALRQALAAAETSGVRRAA